MVILVFFIVTIFRNKREAKRENQLKAEQEKIEISMYEHLAKTFNEKYPDNVFCTPSSFSSFYSDTFITNKPAIHLSKQIMIELDCRGLAKLEKDNQGNFILKKVKK